MNEKLFDKYGHPVNILINHDCPQDLFDKHGRPHIVVEDAEGNDLSNPNMIAVLARRGHFLQLAGLYLRNQVGSGNGWSTAGGGWLSTGATADSSVSADTAAYALHQHGQGFQDWDKKVELLVKFKPSNSNANFTRRIQLKHTTDLGALADKGIGLKIADLALYGESYGTSLAELDLSTTLTSDRWYQLLIVHDPTTPKVSWYLDTGSGMTLLGEQTTSSKIPSGQASGDSHLLLSVQNGAAAAECVLMHAQMFAWGEK